MLADDDQLGGVLRGVPGALRPVGADQVADLAALRRPTWPGSRRSRTRCRRDGRRWPGPAPAWAGPARSWTRASRSRAARWSRRVSLRAPPRAARSSGTSTSQPRRRVPDDPQPQTQATGLGGVAAERPGPVGEAEADLGGQGDDVGAVVPAVGHDRDPGEGGHPGQIGGQGEVGVGHDHPPATGRPRGRRPRRRRPGRGPGPGATAPRRRRRPPSRPPAWSSHTTATGSGAAAATTDRRHAPGQRGPLAVVEHPGQAAPWPGGTPSPERARPCPGAARHGGPSPECRGRSAPRPRRPDGLGGASGRCTAVAAAAPPGPNRAEH